MAGGHDIDPPCGVKVDRSTALSWPEQAPFPKKWLTNIGMSSKVSLGKVGSFARLKVLWVKIVVFGKIILKFFDLKSCLF